MPRPDYAPVAPNPTPAKPSRGRGAASAPAAPAISSWNGPTEIKLGNPAQSIIEQARANPAAVQAKIAEIAQERKSAAELLFQQQQAQIGAGYTEKLQDTADSLVSDAAKQVQYQQDPGLATAERKTQAQDAANAARAQRAQALDTQDHAPVERMTWDQYQALSPREKAAVDFNTMLVRAVRKDTKQAENYTPTDEQRATYDKTVTDLFGEGHGSDTFAPETLAVLKKLDFKDASSDLDDFLQLKTAITSDDIKDIGLRSGSQNYDEQVPLGQNDREMSGVQNHLVESTQSLQEKLAHGAKLLQSVQATAAVDRNPLLAELGGVENKVRELPGYGAPEFTPEGRVNDIDSYFQVAWNDMTNKHYDKTPAQILEQAKADLYKPGQFSAFEDYIASRTQVSDRLDVPLNNSVGVESRGVEHFRKLLGLDQGE